MKRAPVLLDVMARGGMIWLLVIAVGNLRETCRPDEFCDDLGFGRLLLAPAALYLIWNAGVLLATLFAVLPSSDARDTGVLALVALPRLVLLFALTATGDAPWPIPVLLGITVASQGLAYAAWAREPVASVTPRGRTEAS